MPKCARVQPELARLNAATCTNDNDCDGAKTCTSLLPARACVRSVCDEATGAISTQPCAGFCVSGTAPMNTAARLSNDGRQIRLTFDQEVVLAAGAKPRWVQRCCWRCCCCLHGPGVHTLSLPLKGNPRSSCT